MIKQGDGGFPKKDLQNLLEGKERGSHAVACMVIDGKRVTALAWKGKSEKVKGKK